MTTNTRTYIYPPYPNQRATISPRALSQIESNRLYVCQRKFDGSRAVIKISDKSVQLFDRHGGSFVTLSLNENLKFLLLNSLKIRRGVEYWLDGEFLDKKAKSAVTGKQTVTNTIVLFDLLFAGRYLSTESQIDRLDRLHQLCDTPRSQESKNRALLVGKDRDSQLWLAEHWENDFEYRFYEFYDYDTKGNDLFPEIEGLILRKKTFKLTNLGFQKYRVPGLQIVRCRKPSN